MATAGLLSYAISRDLRESILILQLVMQAHGPVADLQN